LKKRGAQGEVLLDCPIGDWQDYGFLNKQLVT
jgi:hypothetical protein